MCRPRPIRARSAIPIRACDARYITAVPAGPHGVVMLVLPARVRVGVTSGGAVMADEETGMLVDTVRQEAHAIVGGGEAALADAARNVAMLRRFCAWNTLLILRARHGIPELVFGWAQWEAMGRFPVSADARIALLSPVRRPVTSGADGVRRHVPLPGPEPSDGRARWMRAEWVPVSAFDAPDTEGRPLESMFLTGDAPQRDTACEALAGMIRALGVAVLVEPGDPVVRLSMGAGDEAAASYDPDLVDPATLAHLVAHLVVGAIDDVRSRAWTLTVMLCTMLGAPAPDAVSLPARMGVVDVLESCRLRLARLESCAQESPLAGSGRGSSRLALPMRTVAPGSRMLPHGRAAWLLSGLDGRGVLVFDGACPACGRLS